MNKLLYLDFPNGARSLYIDGKRYTKESFQAAKRKIKQRNSKGQFLNCFGHYF